jgi:hypothetical protein
MPALQKHRNNLRSPAFFDAQKAACHSCELREAPFRGGHALFALDNLITGCSIPAGRPELQRRRGEERFFGRRGDLRMRGRLLGVGVGADDIDQEGNAVWLCQLNATPEPQAQTQEAE